MKTLVKKLKSGIQSVRAWLRANLSPGQKTLAGATLAIFAGFAIAVLASGAVYVSAMGWLPVAVITVALMAFSFLSAYLGISLLWWLARIPFWLLVAIMAGIPGIMIFFNTTTSGILLILGTIALCCAFIGGALQQFRKGRWVRLKALHKVLTLFLLVAGVSGIAGGVTWLLHPGQPLELPVNAAMSGDNLPPVLDMMNPGEPGSYAVVTLSYGSGNDKRRAEFGAGADAITTPVDASAFLPSWKGFSGNMRTRYFGFDQAGLPLNAKVWYPEGEGPFPLVLIVHGNHLAQNFSDPGYAYLGEHLASRGYIMASVDQNFLNGTFTNIFNGLSNENDARGWLLLKHLEVWQEWNVDENSLFHKKVDMDRIALIGHSRGGEAIGHAALFNRLPYYPDDANEVFDFNFKIRSLIAIAPSDGQYQPARTRTPLADINYLVLQGSHDADVSSYQGMRQFNRISFSDDFDGFRAGVYIWGANHGQFNSVWGRTDFPGPAINLYNLEQLMPEEDQQAIAKTYISAFLDASLRNKTALRNMFIDHRHARHWLPETIYITQFEQPGTSYICTFMEDIDLSTGTVDQSFIHASDLSIWREQTLFLNWGDYNTRALFLGWNTTECDLLLPAYHISFPSEKISTGRESVLTFSLAQSTMSADPPKNAICENNNMGSPEEPIPAHNEAAMEEEPGDAADEKSEEFVDFTVRLADDNGAVLEFPISHFSPLQPPLKRSFTKLPFLQRQAESEIILQTYTFPLARFANLYPEFDFEHINCISFVFNITPQGVVVVNDIGFIRPQDPGIEL